MFGNFLGIQIYWDICSFNSWVLKYIWRLDWTHLMWILSHADHSGPIYTICKVKNSVLLVLEMKHKFEQSTFLINGMHILFLFVICNFSLGTLLLVIPFPNTGLTLYLSFLIFFQLFKTIITLKVPWHEIFLLKNMLPINAFIMEAFLFFKFGREIWLESQILAPETGAWISLLL